MYTNFELDDIINRRTKKNGECIEWTGYMDKKGLPRMFLKRKSYFVHRYTWEKSNPKVLGTEYISRPCKNDKCINIEHLRCIPKKKPIIWSRVWTRLLKHTIRDVDGCLLWTSRMNKKNGESRFQSKTVLAHRLSWMVKHETTIIPHTMDGSSTCIRHLCHHPSCIEPSHLKLGTLSQNHFQDKIDNNTIMRGEKHHAVTISEELASEIKLSKRKRGDDDYVTQRARCARFGVSIHVVAHIDRGSSWAYLPDRDGNTGSSRNAKARVTRQKAIQRVWTADEFDQAAKILYADIKKTTDSNRGEVEGECWEFQGAVLGGYGLIPIFGKNMRTHVLSCEIKNKRHRLVGEVCRHLCGNYLCVNAKHLTFGTPKENAIDSVKQGSISSKLDADKVRDIRRRFHFENPPRYKEVADEYGVSEGTISSVVNNRSWKHV